MSQKRHRVGRQFWALSWQLTSLRWRTGTVALGRESVDVMKLGSLQSSRAALCDQVNPESYLAQLTLETWKLEKGWMAVVRKETNGMLFPIEC